MQSFLGGATRALTRRPVAAFSHRPGRLQGNGALFSRALSSSSPSSKALTVSQVLSLKPADNAQPAPHVIVNGYVRTIRSMKNVKFVTIGDGHGGTLQAVISPGQAEG